MSFLTVSGSDYLNFTQSLTLSPTTMSHTVAVMALTDDSVENQETIIVSVSYDDAIHLSTTVSIVDQTSKYCFINVLAALICLHLLQ